MATFQSSRVAIGQGSSCNACEEYLPALDDRWDDTPGCGGCEMTDLAGSSTASLAVLAAIVGGDRGEASSLRAGP